MTEKGSIDNLLEKVKKAILENKDVYIERKFENIVEVTIGDYREKEELHGMNWNEIESKELYQIT